MLSLQPKEVAPQRSSTKPPLCWSHIADPKVVACPSTHTLIEAPLVQRGGADTIGGGIVKLPICRSFKMIELQSLTRCAGAPFVGGSLFSLCYAGAPYGATQWILTWEPFPFLCLVDNSLYWGSLLGVSDAPR